MNGKLITSAGIFLSGCFFYVQAGRFQQLKAIDQFGPEFWPKIILASLIVLCAGSFISDYIGRRKEAMDTNRDEINNRMLIKGGLLCTAYVFLLDVAGFSITTPIFIAVFMWLSGVKKKQTLFSTSLIFTAAIIGLFGRLLSLPLPRGVSFFREINQFFY